MLALRARIAGGDYPKRAKEVREGADYWWCSDGDKSFAGDPWQADHLVPRDPLRFAAEIHQLQHSSCR